MTLFSQRVPKKRFTARAVLQDFPTAVPVVAAALIAPQGQILMHRRPLAKAHGGLWEFPGGKIERGESRISALIREIEEELGVVLDPARLDHVAQARDGQSRIVIDLYTARAWQGEPRCIEGEEIGWFAPKSLLGLAMPPLDVPLAKALLALLQKPK